MAVFRRPSWKKITRLPRRCMSGPGGGARCYVKPRCRLPQGGGHRRDAAGLDGSGGTICGERAAIEEAARGTDRIAGGDYPGATALTRVEGALLARALCNRVVH